jgi:hypothetical protein
MRVLGLVVLVVSRLWQWKPVQKPFQRLMWGMGKVHAFCDVAFLLWFM